MRPDVTEEALRYMGGADAPEPLRRQTAAELEALRSRLRPRYTCRVWDLDFQPGGIRLAGTNLTLRGETAARMLESCGQAALLACTLGTRFDQLLSAAQARDMAGAVILDACGSALVEQGCDEAEEELSARLPGRYLTDRFSPGYGDLPLDLQRGICAALDAPRRLGIQVTDSLLLNPAKSVTAVIGLSDRPQPARVRGCGHCALAGSCQYRKEGTTCGA